MRTGNINTENKQQKSKKDTTLRSKINMYIWLFIAMFIIYQVITLIMFTLGKKDQNKMWLYNSVNGIVGVFGGSKPSDTIENSTVKLAALGDVYFTANTLKGAKSGTSYDLTKGTEDIENKLKDYDLVMANLNTPIADKSLGYSNGKIYNAPASITELLKKLNVSIVTTATNHSFDKGEKGIASTISTLKEAGIEQAGISSETRSNPAIINKNNISIGVLSYATQSNVKMTEKNKYSVNIFSEEDLLKDVEYLKEKQVDFIIAYLNVPNENSSLTNATQKKHTDKLFDSGVNVVFGSGSMVVQEDVEDEIVTDNVKHHIYSIYSLGDLFGSYAKEENMLSLIGNIEFNKEITKDKEGNVKKTEKSMLVKTPIGIWTTINKSYVKTMYILDDELSKYDQESSEVTQKEYNKMKEASKNIKNLFEE